MKEIEQRAIVYILNIFIVQSNLTRNIDMIWRRKWQPTPVFLPRESHGQRSLVGYPLWGHTESNTTETTLQQQQHNNITDTKAEQKVKF